MRTSTLLLALAIALLCTASFVCAQDDAAAAADVGQTAETTGEQTSQTHTQTDDAQTWPWREGGRSGPITPMGCAV
jgi:hypothetical protein